MNKTDKTVERFTVKDGKTSFSLTISHEPTSSIFSDGKDGFHPWIGGCGIGGNQRTIAGARLICFEQVTSDIDRKIHDYEERLAELKRLRETLGNDVFNLGQFMVKA